MVPGLAGTALQPLLLTLTTADPAGNRTGPTVTQPDSPDVLLPVPSSRRWDRQGLLPEVTAENAAWCWPPGHELCPGGPGAPASCATHPNKAGWIQELSSCPKEALGPWVWACTAGY